MLGVRLHKIPLSFLYLRYNGVIRNKTEKTKGTAGTRVGFWLSNRPRAGVTAKHTRPRTVHADKCTPRRRNGQLAILMRTKIVR